MAARSVGEKRRGTQGGPNGHSGAQARHSDVTWESSRIVPAGGVTPRSLPVQVYRSARVDVLLHQGKGPAHLLVFPGRSRQRPATAATHEVFLGDTRLPRISPKAPQNANRQDPSWDTEVRAGEERSLRDVRHTGPAG
jgi:hypothetical protein